MSFIIHFYILYNFEGTFFERVTQYMQIFKNFHNFENIGFFYVWQWLKLTYMWLEKHVYRHLVNGLNHINACLQFNESEIYLSIYWL